MTKFYVNDYAVNCESGWKGKIRRFYKHDGIEMAEMIGVDFIVQNTLFMSNEECLSEDDIQHHATADLVLINRTTEQKLAIALEALKEIGNYYGEGSRHTTPWQDIVANLGETARNAMTDIEQ